MTLLGKARIALAVFGGLYAIAVGLLAHPTIQGHTLYLNVLRFPFFANYDAPQKYALAPNKTYNVKIGTPDNETLGAWFTLADPFYHSLGPEFPPPISESNIGAALKHHPTILFLHGNAGTRAFHVRVQHYKAFSSRFSANVLAIDYRGFAESTGTPSEVGLVTDARAAFDWLVSYGARSEDILIYGHSLGTGVGGNLAAMLSNEKIGYRGVVLTSPFSSIAKVLETYHILGLIPLISPLKMFPFAMQFINSVLVHKFDTLGAVPRIKGQVVIAHAENDLDIPSSHSETLFTGFLDPYLPALNYNVTPGVGLSHEEYTELGKQIDERNAVREKLVLKRELLHFGTIEEATVDGRTVTFVKTLEGKHDYIGLQEGVQDIIGRRFGLF